MGGQWLYHSSNQWAEKQEVTAVKCVLSYLWNSSVRSSPSAWLIRQCLSMATRRLYSAVSSFTHTLQLHTPHILQGFLLIELIFFSQYICQWFGPECWSKECGLKCVNNHWVKYSWDRLKSVDLVPCNISKSTGWIGIKPGSDIHAHHNINCNRLFLQRNYPARVTFCLIFWLTPTKVN